MAEVSVEREHFPVWLQWSERLKGELYQGGDSAQSKSSNIDTDKDNQPSEADAESHPYQSLKRLTAMIVQLQHGLVLKPDLSLDDAGLLAAKLTEQLLQQPMKLKLIEDQIRLLYEAFEDVNLLKSDKKLALTYSEQLSLDVIQLSLIRMMNSRLVNFDLARSPQHNINHDVDELTAAAWCLFWFLCIAGALNAGASGFDSIKSIVILFTYSHAAIATAAAVCACLSIFIFYGFDFPQSCQGWGLSFSLFDYETEVDSYLAQMEAFKQYVQSLSNCLAEQPERYEEFKNDFAIIKAIAAKLKSDQDALNLDNVERTLTQVFIGAVVFSLASILYFSNGFFFGSYFVADAFLGMNLTQALTSFWPAVSVISYGLTCGTLTWLLFCGIDAIGVNELLDTLFGIPRDKIATFRDYDTVEILKGLENQIKSISKLHGRQSPSGRTNGVFAEQNDESDSKPLIEKPVETQPLKGASDSFKSSTSDLFHGAVTFLPLIELDGAASSNSRAGCHLDAATNSGDDSSDCSDDDYSESGYSYISMSGSASS